MNEEKNIKWYKFWKQPFRSPTITSTVYCCYSEDELGDTKKETDEILKEDCEIWAKKQPGGSETGFNFGWENIKHPPLEYLHKKLEYAQNTVFFYIKEIGKIANKKNKKNE